MDRRFLRPGWIAGHVLVLAAVLTCLRLGWWQWERTHETTGTAQNFGYALLWPAFGAAFIYMWVRFLHLEVLKDDEENEATDRDLRELLDAYGEAPSDPSGVPEVRQTPAGDSAAGFEDSAPDPEITTGEPETEPADNTTKTGQRQPRQQRPSQAVTISVAMVGGDDEDDPELIAYNQALAALAEEDRRRAR